MTRRRHLPVAAALVVMGLIALLVPARGEAQGSCRATCWEGYGACYKATNNRQRCQAQLQRCLNGCIRGRKN